jgi:ketosteroid isomerase-like protein
MRNGWAGAGLALAVVAAGCAGPDQEAMRSALMAADRAFAEATAQRGAEGWTSSFTDDGRQFHQRGVSIGKAEIRRVMEAAFADTTRRLVWHPLYAEVARSADLGYTIGRWESRARGADGTWTRAGSGNYVTIWRRQADGSWKVAADIGNEDRAAAGAGER